MQHLTVLIDGLPVRELKCMLYKKKINGKREALVFCFGLECNVYALLDPFEFLMM